MDISIFTDSPFGDDAAFKDFLLANSLNHSQNATALEQRGKSISVSPIADMGDNERDWLSVHAGIHAQEFARLGLTGLPDLEGVDLQDERQYYDWMLMHSLVHQAVSQALGNVN